MLQVCVNGAREHCAHAVLPRTPPELARAVRDAVAAGAQEVHLHPKNGGGEDTLESGSVAAAVTAVRAAAPGVPVGVTTGAWATPDPAERAARVRSWTVLPDHASVNWHEDGAETVATALWERGVGIEAGIYSGTEAAGRFLAWREAHRVLRVLAEITDPDPRTAPATAAGLVATLSPVGRPVLLHGEDATAWPLLRVAAGRGLSVRIGLEDVDRLPDGTPAADNAALVRAARGLLTA